MPNAPHLDIGAANEYAYSTDSARPVYDFVHAMCKNAPCSPVPRCPSLLRQVGNPQN